MNDNSVELDVDEESSEQSSLLESYFKDTTGARVLEVVASGGAKRRAAAKKKQQGGSSGSGESSSEPSSPDHVAAQPVAAEQVAGPYAEAIDDVASGIGGDFDLLEGEDARVRVEADGRCAATASAMAVLAKVVRGCLRLLNERREAVVVPVFAIGWVSPPPQCLSYSVSGGYIRRG